ncbi:MAG: DUF2062 domain-containing protein [Candidatus Omnitrophica bacterium]|nr:DUF2062 domain-containing protein [Candidatus Omnitrophota bacterium]
MNKTMLGKIAGFFKLIYVKLVRINDSPHKIAVGFGLGVFAGIMPFAGPLAALLLAFIFKVNRASALLGGFVTNTWITVIAFLFSIKVGSLIFGMNADVIRSRWTALLKDFHISSFFKLSALEIILPVVTGYLAIAAISACAAYAAIIVIMKFIRIRKRIKKCQ